MNSKYHSLFKSFKWFSIALPLALTAYSTHSSSTLIATDTSSIVSTHVTSNINLYNNIKNGDQSVTTLDSVKLITTGNQCDQAVLGKLSFQVTPPEKGVCLYEYQISDQNSAATATAISRVIAMPSDAKLASYIDSSLPTIIENIKAGEEVKVHLAPPSGMTLSEDVVLIGSGSVSDVNLTDNTISYVAEAERGMTRLDYYYTSDDGSVMPGVIIVSISATPKNRSLTQTSSLVELSKDDTASIEAVVGKSMTVDLNNIAQSSVNSGTDSNLGLVTVYSSQGVAWNADPNNEENTSFRFLSNTTGQYDVTYQLKDANGNFTVDTVSFNVTKDFQNVALEYDSQNRVFIAPLTKEEAIYLGLNISDYKTYGKNSSNGPAYFVQPLVKWKTAQSYCQSIGARLPTLAELSSLYAQEGNLYQSSKSGGWPVGIPYFTSDFENSSVKMLKLKNGKLFTESLSGFNGTFSCITGDINNSSLSLRIEQSGKVSANTTIKLTGQYTFNGTDYTDITDSSDYYWFSSDHSIMTVDNYGVLTTKSLSGSAIITMTSKADSSLSASSVFAVNVPVLTLSLNIKESGELPANSSTQLTGQYTYGSGGYTNITDPTEYIWSSSNNRVMTVDNYGVVTTNTTSGTATIYMRSKTDPSAYTTSIFSVNYVVPTIKSPLYGTIRSSYSNSQFATVASDNLLIMRCGAVVDAFGTSNNLIGGNGGNKKSTSRTNIKYIDITTSKFTFDYAGRVISRLKFVYKNGQISTCGLGSSSKYNSSSSTSRFTITDGYQIYKITGYAKPHGYGSNYMHAVQFTLKRK